MVSKGLVLRWLTDKEIRLIGGKKKTADLLAELIAVANVAFCLLTLWAIYRFSTLGAKNILAELYTEDSLIEESFLLNTASVFILAAFIAIFLSIWPKTRSREENKHKNYEDPSFLVLAIVFTIWNIMLMLKISWVFPGCESILSPKTEWKGHLIDMLDILNSGFFLLAALQFDFEYDREKSRIVQPFVKLSREWLNQKFRITKLLILSLGLYLILVLSKPLFSLDLISIVKVWKTPIMLMGIFTITILGFFMEQLYRERQFGFWLRRAVSLLVAIAFILTLIDCFELESFKKISAPIMITLSSYRFGWAAVFLLLAFSFKEKKEESLRNTLLNVETQKSHFAKSQVDLIYKELKSLEQRKQQNVNASFDKLFKVLESVRSLNNLIFTYRAERINKNTFRSNLDNLLKQLSAIFYYWESGVVVSRISAKIDIRDVEKISLSSEKQLDITRLITELCLNGSKAYANETFSNTKDDGNIKIEVNGGRSKDISLSKLIITISNDAPANEEDYKKIDNVFAELGKITPRKLRQLSEKAFDEISEQPSFEKTVSSNLGLWVITGICQENDWKITRVKSHTIAPKGVCVQIYIPLENK